MRPVIGYTIELEDPYVAELDPLLRGVLDAAGAFPLMLSRNMPVTDVAAVLDLIDALQICGGEDIDPAYYGESERHPRTNLIPPNHDRVELALVRGALERGMPVFGICRGAQVIAVAAGGRLYQDVESLHDGAGRHWHDDWGERYFLREGEHVHDVLPEPGSLVARWFGEGPLAVNSFHHQGVRDPGPLLRVGARARDGVIEAVERADGEGFAVGLQWHNEIFWPHDPRYEAPQRAFVDAARAYHAARLGR